MSILLGAWLAVRGIESSVAPLVGVWQLAWAGWSGDGPDPRAVILTFMASFLWFAGAAVASLVGWAIVLRGVEMILERRADDQ